MVKKYIFAVILYKIEERRGMYLILNLLCENMKLDCEAKVVISSRTEHFLCVIVCAMHWHSPIFFSQCHCVIYIVSQRVVSAIPAHCGKLKPQTKVTGEVEQTEGVARCRLKCYGSGMKRKKVFPSDRFNIIEILCIHNPSLCQVVGVECILHSLDPC